MKTRSALGVLALVLGMTLPAPAQAPAATSHGGDDLQIAQAPPAPPRPEGGRGEWRGGPMRGQGDWHRHMTHRFSLAGLALRHQQELALTPPQVQTLRQLNTDTQREAIKREADRRLAELDLRTLMMPDPTDPDKPRDLAKIEAQVREIERLRTDGRIARVRAMEQSRQVLTPEQRQKLRMLFAQRLQHRGPHGPEAPRVHGMAPYDDRHAPADAEES